MNFIILLLILMASLAAGADCTQKNNMHETLDKIEDTVAVPKQLRDALIEVTTVDGKHYRFNANEYMVAKRVSTTYFHVVNNEKEVTCTTNHAPKNEAIVGFRRDYVGMDKTVGASGATLGEKKDLVLDAAYVRHAVFTVFGRPINLGVGVDTNATPKGMVGTDW